MGSGASSPRPEMDGSEIAIEHLSRRISNDVASSSSSPSSFSKQTVTLEDCRVLFGPEILDSWPKTQDAVEKAFIGRERMTLAELVNKSSAILGVNEEKRSNGCGSPASSTEKKIYDAAEAFRVLAELKKSMAQTMEGIKRAQATSKRTSEILSETRKSLDDKMEHAREQIDRATENIARAMGIAAGSRSRRHSKFAPLADVTEGEDEDGSEGEVDSEDDDSEAEMIGGSSTNHEHSKEKKAGKEKDKDRDKGKDKEVGKEKTKKNGGRSKRKIRKKGTARKSAVGWVKPTARERKRAVLLKMQESHSIPAAFQDAPKGAFAPIRFPSPGDWLDEHKERGQTFKEFSVLTQISAKNGKPKSMKRVIELVPIGDFDADVSDDVDASARIYVSSPAQSHTLRNLRPHHLRNSPSTQQPSFWDAKCVLRKRFHSET